MKLQDFIEKNIGKDIVSETGSSFLYDSIFVNVRYLNDGFVVSINLPWGEYFEMKIDYKDLNTDNGDTVGFYHWLETKFFPLASEKLNKTRAG